MKLLATRRLLRILRVVIRYRLDDLLLALPLPWPLRLLGALLPWRWLPRKPLALSRGERLRLALEDLGPIFIKFGQLLSTRRDLLPLRVAADLPKYRADAASRVLPWVYGRVTLAPVPLDEAGLEWLVADHPVVAVDAVRSEGKALDGWQLVQRLDETGRAIATLRLTRAPESELAVQVVGRRDDTSGAVLEHPAAIAADLLRRCGWAPDADAFQGLRDDFPGMALGLVFAERI